MKYRRFFIFIVELFAVCSAILFIPVINVRAVYATQSASFHANLISVILKIRYGWRHFFLLLFRPKPCNLTHSACLYRNIFAFFQKKPVGRHTILYCCTCFTGRRQQHPSYRYCFPCFAKSRPFRLPRPQPLCPF